MQGDDSSRQSAMFSDKGFDVVEKVEELAKKKGVTTSQLALAWTTHQPGITSPIIGPRTMEQLEDNLEALNVEVTDEDREAIDAIVPPKGVVAPYYEADWSAPPHLW